MAYCRCLTPAANQMLVLVSRQSPPYCSIRTMFVSTRRPHKALLKTLHASRRRPSVIRWQSQSAPKKRLLNITPQSLLVAALITGMVAAVYIWLEWKKFVHQAGGRIAALSDSGIGTLNWTLTDQNGKRREYAEFRGQWLILYFGFTHCPDICPEELEKLVEVVEGIDGNPSTPDIQPIFITLDPGRDTVEYMHKYCKDFSPKLIGFTGTTEEIDTVAKSFKTYYSLGEKDEDGDYIVDHTILMYLINPDGKIVDVYDKSAKADGIIRGSIKHISEHEKLRRKTFLPF
ncbi:protein SCO2 homolog, mitochondrial-like [Watersipora subatra]|uniref:protein SCO2 homolog, mitochondrial-like n=1 Tax=Watersipora subatra TaxID=2589382 RepID=UPI00355C47B0